MAIQEIACPDCVQGFRMFDSDGWELCRRCWGAKVIEVQSGTKTAREVSDLANLRSDGAILARWEADRERQG